MLYRDVKNQRLELKADNIVIVRPFDSTDIMFDKLEQFGSAYPDEKTISGELVEKSDGVFLVISTNSVKRNVQLFGFEVEKPNW